MLSVKVIIKEDDLRRYCRRIEDACGGVACGIKPDKQYPDGRSVAEVAMINEFGIMDGITEHPPRPFMRTTMEDNDDKYKKMIVDGLRAMPKISKGAVNLILEKCGREMEDDMRHKLEEWSPFDPRPNKTSTENSKQKKNNGNMGNSGIDSGIMKNSIEHWLLTREDLR